MIDSGADNSAQALQSVNVWPLTYADRTGESPKLVLVALCIMLGAAVVLISDRVASKKTESRNTDQVVRS